jgi:alpha-galactosidase/6-phospho-beta-glucosidase family protein
MEGGERALLMSKDKENNYHRQHVTNVLNNGTIPSLPDNCVVEVPCYFKNGKIYPSKVGSLPNKINDIVKIHAKNQQLVVDAALSGDPNDVLKTLLADPMCRFIEDEEKIEAMMWNMFYYQKRWLPKFSESIPSINELKNSKYYIDIKELNTKEVARMGKFNPDPNLKAKSWPQVD